MTQKPVESPSQDGVGPVVHRPLVCRLAPSPTGAQHLGNARTFLIAYWSARRQNAQLMLRIEDIDSPRVKSWATDQVLQDLRWLGITWDGLPMRQTEQQHHYENALSALKAAGRVYPCTCTRRDIEAAASAPHDEGDAPPYPGTCASWEPGDRMPDAGTYCWRFRMRPGRVMFEDRVAGTQAEQAERLGDFPVTRKQGMAAYQLAVVVDDIRAGVTEVVRGDDLITSTFRQLQLYEAFGQAPPSYAHVPLVVGSDGRRLAKRHGDTRLSEFRSAGVPAHQIVTWAARSTGWMPDGATDAGDIAALHEQMSRVVDWDRIHRSPVVLADVSLVARIASLAKPV